MNKLHKVIATTALTVLTASSFAMASSPDSNINDQYVNSTIQTKVSQDLAVKDINLELSTVNGHVKIMGQVPSNYHYSEAVRLASSTPGVKDIDTSDLHVKASKNYLADTTITGKIKGKLTKKKLIQPNQPSPFYVNVETNNKSVFLSGRVKDKHQAKSAIETAYSVSGVKDVVSYLKIEDITNPVRA